MKVLPHFKTSAPLPVNSYSLSLQAKRNFPVFVDVLTDKRTLHCVAFSIGVLDAVNLFIIGYLFYVPKHYIAVTACFF